MKINVEQALVKTATVEIRALTVSGKQVTLAVFRQLQIEQVVDFETFQLNGPVWGKVNYHSAHCPGLDHEHLVWQSGAELRCCLVDVEADNGGWQARSDRRERIRAAAYAVMATKALAGELYPGLESPYYTVPMTFVFEGTKYEVSTGSNTGLRILFAGNYWATRKEISPSDGQRKELEEVRCDMGVRFPYDTVTALANLRGAELEMAAWERGWERLYNRLKDVQQLFIAV